MHARALEELEEVLTPGCRALDVGSGSGFLTAAMAELVGPTGEREREDLNGRTLTHRALTWPDSG